MCVPTCKIQEYSTVNIKGAFKRGSVSSDRHCSPRRGTTEVPFQMSGRGQGSQCICGCQYYLYITDYMSSTLSLFYSRS